MDHVLARIKGLRKKPYRKVISDHTLFDTLNIDVATCVDYSPDHNLDEDAWFKIENFSMKGFCLDILKQDFDSKDYESLAKEQFSKIAYLLAMQDNDFYVQKLTSSLFVAKKMIGFGEIAKIEETTDRIVVNSKPDAIYKKDVDTLIFRSLATITSIFKGIDELFREATDGEVNEFLQEEFLELSEGYGLDKVSKPNRKRISLAMKTLDEMPEDDKDVLLTYIDSYCKDKLTYDTENKKFEVKSDDQLKYLLYGLEERFYTTNLGKEKRLANSVEPM